MPLSHGRGDRHSSQSRILLLRERRVRYSIYIVLDTDDNFTGVLCHMNRFNCDHAMIDLETLDNKPTAIPLTLGAVKFNPYKGIVHSKFYRRWSLKSASGFGLTMSPETLTWWMSQSVLAQREAFGGSDDFRQAVHEFSGWYVGCKCIWGHGSIFDVSIMDNVHRALKISSPYDFRDVRDTRTLYDLGDTKVDRAVGTHHVAVDDAVQQAIAVCYAYRAIGLAPFVGKVKCGWDMPTAITSAVDERGSVLTPEQIVETAARIEESTRQFDDEMRVVIDPRVKY